jgi:SAM-dependent methyltransferase
MMLNWDGDSFTIGETSFKILPDGVLGDRVDWGDAEFFVFKDRELVDMYVGTIERLKPKRILELGVFQGGSTALLLELASPHRLVAIDHVEMGGEHVVESYAADRGFDDVVRIHGEVDQADRGRLAELVETDFGGEPLDLVIDDCSHMYEATRASFNELFPRLRPDGLYLIEDWSWAHTAVGAEPLEGLWPEHVPLTRLLFELVLAIPSVPGLIADVSVAHRAAVVRRGEAAVSPGTFDISTCSNPRGQRLIAPPQAAG